MGLEILDLDMLPKINNDMKKDISFFRKNGYLLLKDFLPKEDIKSVLFDAKNVFLKQFIEKEYLSKSICLEDLTESEYNKCLFRLFEDDIECLSNCGKQVQHLISLHALSLNQKIVSLLKEIGINSPTISTRPVLYFNHPKLAKKKVFHTVDAHQDWRSMQGSLNSVVIWIPLVDVNKDLGALEILPGSHLEGLRTNHIDYGFGMVELNNKEIENFVPVEVKSGDALLFSSFLIHQSGNNITDNPRWSCHFRYNDLDELSFIKRKYAHAYIYKPVENLITNNFPLVEDISKIYSK